MPLQYMQSTATPFKGVRHHRENGGEMTVCDFQMKLGSTTIQNGVEFTISESKSQTDADMKLKHFLFLNQQQFHPSNVRGLQIHL